MMEIIIQNKTYTSMSKDEEGLAMSKILNDLNIKNKFLSNESNNTMTLVLEAQKFNIFGSDEFNTLCNFKNLVGKFDINSNKEPLADYQKQPTI